MTFEVGTFKAEDLELIDPHPIYLGSADLLKSQALSIQKLESSIAVSLYMDGKVEASLGLVMLWDGHANAWSFVSRKIQEHPVAFHRTVARLLSSCERELKLRRISAGTPASFTEGQRLLSSLNFRREGLMLNYGPDGTDWFLYARTS